MNVPGPGDNPIITVLIATLFLVGILYKNWMGNFRDWIHARVAEA